MISWEEIQKSLSIGKTNIGTGYINKVRQYEKMGYRLVPICGGLPDWFHPDINTTYWCRRLAPKWKFFNEWKEGKINNDEYIECYYDQVLEKIKPKEIIREIKEELLTDKFVILCYEKPFDFCHRHIVAHWLNTKLHMDIKEVDAPSKTQRKS